MKILSFKTKVGWITLEEKFNKFQRIQFRKKKKINTNIQISGTLLQKKIWNELSNIPYGSTKSYGEVAAKVKTSPRYVGNVCGQNQHVIVIPCHRVIRSDGNLGGFSGIGGVKLKKKLIDLEKMNV